MTRMNKQGISDKQGMNFNSIKNNFNNINSLIDKNNTNIVSLIEQKERLIASIKNLQQQYINVIERYTNSTENIREQGEQFDKQSAYATNNNIADTIVLSKDCINLNDNEELWYTPWGYDPIYIYNNQTEEVTRHTAHYYNPENNDEYNETYCKAVHVNSAGHGSVVTDPWVDYSFNQDENCNLDINLGSGVTNSVMENATNNITFDPNTNKPMIKDKYTLCNRDNSIMYSKTDKTYYYIGYRYNSEQNGYQLYKQPITNIDQVKKNKNCQNYFSKGQSYNDLSESIDKLPTGPSIELNICTNTKGVNIDDINSNFIYKMQLQNIVQQIQEKLILLDEIIAKLNNISESKYNYLEEKNSILTELQRSINIGAYLSDSNTIKGDMETAYLSKRSNYLQLIVWCIVFVLLVCVFIYMVLYPSSEFSKYVVIIIIIKIIIGLLILLWNYLYALNLV